MTDSKDFEGLSYNSQRNQVKNKEFGRGLQQYVEYIQGLPDKETRTQATHQLVKMVRMLNPGLRKNQEDQHRIWDQIQTLADFKLDVDSPFPIPEESAYNKKPERMTYPTGRTRYRHYGHGVENMIALAADLKDKEQQYVVLSSIGNIMKNFYRQWNKTELDDKLLVKHIYELSKGKINLDLTEVEDLDLFTIKKRTNYSSRSNSNRRGSFNKRGNKKRTNNNQRTKRKSNVYPKKK